MRAGFKIVIMVDGYSRYHGFVELVLLILEHMLFVGLG